MLKNAILDAKICENLAKIWRNFDEILTKVENETAVLLDADATQIDSSEQDLRATLSIPSSPDASTQTPADRGRRSALNPATQCHFKADYDA